MKTCYVLLGLALSTPLVYGQTVLQDARLEAGSDAAGAGGWQPGTEVIHSTPGYGSYVAPGGRFAHVGQFFVAASGLWNAPEQAPRSGQEFFGYEPGGAGVAYQGRGIRGASASPAEAGHPRFGQLYLNSTGLFPLQGGLTVSQALVFDAYGPAQGNLITTPNCTDPAQWARGVVFEADASIEGAGEQNFVAGFATVEGVTQYFTLPLGERSPTAYSYCPLTVGGPAPGRVTAGYTRQLRHPAGLTGEGLSTVLPVGNWQIEAPAGTAVSVLLPIPADHQSLERLGLVGWDGSRWIDLGGVAAVGPGERLTLSGRVPQGITDLAAGIRAATAAGELQLLLWPNPVTNRLFLQLNGPQQPARLRVLSVQGTSMLEKQGPVSHLDVGTLAAGAYVLEVTTEQGGRYRKSFVKP